MLKLLTFFLNLCLFRAKTHELPASSTLLVTSAALSIISQALVLTTFPNEAMHRALINSVVSVLVYGALIWLLLKFNNYTERWIQTFTALSGSNALIQFTEWPIAASVGKLALGNEGFDPELFQAFVEQNSSALMILMFLGIWLIAVITSIIKQALETSTGMALLTTLATIILTQILAASILSSVLYS